MKKGDIYKGEVLYVNFPNKGMVKPLAHKAFIGESESGVCNSAEKKIEASFRWEEVSADDGTNKVMVKNVIPGQIIEFRLTKKHHGDCEGLCLNVLEKASDEVEPHCPHFGKCGGCSYQNLEYEKQLKLKEDQVKKLLRPVLGDELDNPSVYKGVKGSPNMFAYKNKMEFSFGDEKKGGELTLGLHKRGSFHDIVPVEECQIVCEDIRKILKAVIAECRRQNLTYFHRISHEGYLRHLLVRRSESTGELLVDLFTTSQCEMDEKAFLDALLAIELKGSFAGIIHSINDSVADVCKADSAKILYGKDYFYEEILGLKFKVSTFSFFQTNSAGAEVLYDTARSFIREEYQGKGVVYDLYSGTGTIGQLLSTEASQVIGVEIVEEAVEAARDNTALNGITNCEFLCGDVLKVIDEIETKPDFIVLDPPRDGIHPKALPKLTAYGVEKMIYISCKPTSLARDLPFFIENGYHVTKVAMVDMFPWTANIETIVCLSRGTYRRPDAKIKIDIDLDDYYAIKNREMK